MLNLKKNKKIKMYHTSCDCASSDANIISKLLMSSKQSIGNCGSISILHIHEYFYYCHYFLKHVNARLFVYTLVLFPEHIVI